jgi:arylsulfatase A-like enzyme/Tfp pilus assembly protein PilF
VAIALLGAACSPRPADGPARSSNLLLVTVDTVRADRLGCYGYALAETPAIDRLAHDGVRFARAMATAPLTLPSHASLLTGLLPPRHALHQNGAAALPTSVPTLAEAFQAGGFRTGAFVGSFVLDHRFGLARGFEVYDDELPRDPADQAPGLEAERAGSAVVDRALAWLGRDDARPFFAWVHLYDAHAPYEPPEPYRSRFADRLYDGEVAAVDAAVGRLVAWLDQRKLSSSTVVALVGDHGESLGEHGELTHGLLLYEPTLHVPLLVKAPGRLRRGMVVEEPVGLADLAPTLAGLAGASFASGSAAIDGRDLSSALVAGAEPPRADLYAETEYPQSFGWSVLAALRRGPAKYISAPTPRLFDLRSDPGETTNLLDASQPESRKENLAATLETVRERGGSAVDRAPLDAEARAKLAALGYVGGAVASAAAPASAEGADPHERVALFRSFEEAHWATLAGRPAEAARTLAPLVLADPGNVVFRSHLARAYRDAGDLAGAVREYRRAVEMSPGDSQAGYELAMSLQASGRYDEATAALARVLESDAERPEAHNALGILYSLQGRPDAAREQFARVVELDPADPLAWNNLGNALRELRQLDGAADAYRRSIGLAPRYAEPLNGLGSVLVAQKRPGEALPLFDRALELQPDRHEIRLNRAVALEVVGDRVGALDAYRDFLRAADAAPEFAEQRAMAMRLASRLAERESAPASEQGVGRSQ